MKYDKIVKAKFLDRPNRFIAHVELDGQVETVHVKNTGRCKELLVPGCKVGLTFPEMVAERKTPCDLVQVDKETSNGILKVNMDSQAPNKLVEEFLKTDEGKRLFPGLKTIRKEVVCGESRLDFCLEDEHGLIWIDVKGCTLERDGFCFFPDAPTIRGTKHLNTLKNLAQSGVRAAVFFVIQMSGMKSISPNRATDPDFSNALADAAKAGVRLIGYDCRVTDGAVSIKSPVPVVLA